MTTEEFEKVALWMGWEKGPDELDGLWFDSVTGKVVGRADKKTSLTPAECYEALNRLVEKGYLILLSGGNGEYSLAIAKAYKVSVVTEIVDGETYYPTIHEAVEQALLQIAAKEG